MGVKTNRRLEFGNKKDGFDSNGALDLMGDEKKNMGSGQTVDQNLSKKKDRFDSDRVLDQDQDQDQYNFPQRRQVKVINSKQYYKGSKVQDALEGGLP